MLIRYSPAYLAHSLHFTLLTPSPPHLPTLSFHQLSSRSCKCSQSEWMTKSRLLFPCSFSTHIPNSFIPSPPQPTPSLSVIISFPCARVGVVKDDLLIQHTYLTPSPPHPLTPSLPHPLTPSLSVIISFPLDEDPTTSVIAWTTTPWTLPSNLALCVHPNFTYVKVRNETTGRRNVLIIAFRLLYILYSYCRQ